MNQNQTPTTITLISVETGSTVTLHYSHSTPDSTTHFYSGGREIYPFTNQQIEEKDSGDDLYEMI